MALRVWLPLNGNLENKGLSPAMVEAVTTPVYVDGKIGKCLSEGKIKIPAEYVGDIFNNEHMSICFWYNNNTDSTSGNHAICGFSGNGDGDSGATRIWDFFNYSTPNIFHWSMGTLGNGTLEAFPANTWVHMAITFDGSNLLIYKNGQLAVTQTGKTSAYTFDKSYYISFGKTPQKLNDFRIYDECLSPKQVKEISKGLVAHYKLDNKYLEATTNLTSLSTFTSGCYNGATNKYGYGENTDIYKEIGVFQGKKCLKIYMGTSGLSARPYPYISNLFVSDGTNQPAYKTLSFDYYGTVGNYLNPYKLGSGSGTCTWTNDKTTTKTGSFTNSGNIPVVLNQWQHITMTLHGTTEANSEWGYVIIGDTHTSNVNNYWLFANVQLETKDHETGYTEGNRVAQTYESDCSGNGYHGTTNGILAFNSDTGRYEGSTRFTTNAAYIKLPVLTTTGFANSFTIIYWAKIADMSDKMAWGFQNGNRLNIYPTGSKICCNTGDGANNPYQNDSGTDIGFSQWNDGNWHQYAMVGDGTTNKLYVDGEYQGKAKTYKGISGTQIYISGWGTGTDYKWTNGSISDFRMYATALSANDIKQLYQTSALVDKGQSFYTYEFKEV